MLVFREYCLDAATVSTQTLYLPLGAEIVSAHSVYSGIALDVLIDPNESSTTLRKLKVCLACENLYEDTVKYIDTVTVDSGTKYIVELL